MNLLCEANANVQSIILVAVLAVFLIAYIIFGTFSRKKNQEKAMQMLNELKQGDKVVTNAGIYGEIVSIKETNMGKVVTIKTGDEESKKFGYISVNASVILGIDEKKDLILDADGNVIDDEDEKQELKEEVLKEEAENNKEQETKAEEKPKKKTSKK